MKISEIFYSIQGEGPRVGKKTIFIRLAECNLRCKFCDTKYTYKGREMDAKEIINRIKSYSCKHVVWTGGEPTLQIKQIIKIIKKLKDYSHDIETNGTKFFPNNLFDTIVISPKKHAINNKLIKNYKNFDNVYFKFVIEDKLDYKFWKEFINKLGINKNKIYFMPEAKDKETLTKKSRWLIKGSKNDGFNFSTRLQILKSFR